VSVGLRIPDIRRHTFSRQPLAVDPAKKTLFYELVCVIYKPHYQNVQVGQLGARRGKTRE